MTTVKDGGFSMGNKLEPLLSCNLLKINSEHSGQKFTELLFSPSLVIPRPSTKI